MSFATKFRCVLFLMILAGFAFAQTPVLIDQYPNTGRIDGSGFGGQETIFFEPTTGYLATGVTVNRDSITSYVSVDGGVSWLETEYINGSADEVRWFSVSGDATQPIYVFSKRGSTPTADPWVRHNTFLALDDFGWGGSTFSTFTLATQGTLLDVLDVYIAQFGISSYDPNLRAVAGHHGSSQVGGEYQQMFYSTDGGQTWSDRFKVVSSTDEDSLSNYFVDDLTAASFDFEFGPGGTILAAGTAQFAFDGEANEHLWWRESADSGATWGDVQLIPGSEDLNVDWGTVDRGWNVFVDGNGEFHVFALAEDSLDVWSAYDFKYSGGAWTRNRFVEGQFVDNGLVALEDDINDTGPLNAATLKNDGTIYYSFIDVKDTTGGNTYGLYTVASTDHGATWSDRIELIADPEYNAEEFTDVASIANDMLHIVYCTVDSVDGQEIVSQYYLGFPSTTSITDHNEGIVADFQLEQNYPNPFNPSTSITYSLSSAAQVELTIFNTLGQQIGTLVSARQSAGEYTVHWDGNDMFGKPATSGVYFYRLATESGFSQVRKMLLLK